MTYNRRELVTFRAQIVVVAVERIVLHHPTRSTPGIIPLSAHLLHLEVCSIFGSGRPAVQSEIVTSYSDR